MKSAYRQFLEGKIVIAERHGFDVAVEDIHPECFPHQKDAIRWAAGLGRALIAMSFGLGKTRIQCELARLHWMNSHPIIARVLKENAGADEQTIRKALRDAYPFGMREYHPYKVWLDEIAVQRGTKKKKNIFGRKKKKVQEDPRQERMF